MAYKSNSISLSYKGIIEVKLGLVYDFIRNQNYYNTTFYFSILACGFHPQGYLMVQDTGTAEEGKMGEGGTVLLNQLSLSFPATPHSLSFAGTHSHDHTCVQGQLENTIFYP